LRVISRAGLFGTDVFLGAFNAGMAEQQLLCRMQIAGLVIDMGGSVIVSVWRPFTPDRHA